MASVVRMPSVLAGATQAVVASWLVAPGDTVAVGDPLAEIETEKAIVEYGAEEAGVVGRIVLAAGDTGEIGAPIAVLVTDGETDADIDAALGGEASPAVPPARTRLFASPIVRKIAREEGIDLATVAGTGPNGRIVRRDLGRLAGRAGRRRAKLTTAASRRRRRPRPGPPRPARSSRTPLSGAPSRAGSPRARRRRRTST